MSKRLATLRMQGERRKNFEDMGKFVKLDYIRTLILDFVFLSVVE